MLQISRHFFISSPSQSARSHHFSVCKIILFPIWVSTSGFSVLIGLATLRIYSMKVCSCGSLFSYKIPWLLSSSHCWNRWTRNYNFRFYKMLRYFFLSPKSECAFFDPNRIKELDSVSRVSFLFLNGSWASEMVALLVFGFRIA
ncbi:hypothetical protein L1987_32623 [Smallanthus sonchifolius]|uniref:Uncharacterized protein n=1 Tax=Smallanthus sonchifolius TaxID=185202 RepID=A0ACB9HRB8_9ASTR|nr:hypothetical protein L1987_32623 [Smallanthus sonchifolius]